MSDLTAEVKEFVLDQGAHLVGIAPVGRFEGAPKGSHPCELLEGAQSVIVYAIRFFRSALECDRFESELMGEGDLWAAHEDFFYGFMYDTVNRMLQMVGIQTTHLLSSRGYKSLPLKSTGDAHFLSHRHAAVLAGLGEIGLNNLLITPEYGPRVRLNSVITTAALTPDPLLEEQLCLGEDECGLCLKAERCFREIEEWNVGGKTMKVARMPGHGSSCEVDKGSGLCRKHNPDGRLPYVRYCWGVCPIGRNQD